ncbi:hypothetical protein TNCV_3844331 [Trichonephila clavipes]|nr:hypothetical protein TNCV_3844331 [Trichonephila clavipes]
MGNNRKNKRRGREQIREAREGSADEMKEKRATQDNTAEKFPDGHWEFAGIAKARDISCEERGSGPKCIPDH